MMTIRCCWSRFFWLPGVEDVAVCHICSVLTDSCFNCTTSSVKHQCTWDPVTGWMGKLFPLPGFPKNRFRAMIENATRTVERLPLASVAEYLDKIVDLEYVGSLSHIRWEIWYITLMKLGKWANPKAEKKQVD